MPIDLHLNTFLTRVQSASSTDTLVAKEGGKIEARGRFRTFFTGTEKYRETTRQFVDKYCAANGVNRDFAARYFEENLREQGATPLSARKVKNFLTLVTAKEVEKAARLERFHAFMDGGVDKMEHYGEVSALFLETAQLQREGVGDAEFVEVLESLKLCFLDVPTDQVARTPLFKFAKDILDDASLSTEQCTRRLNLLSAFVDPSNPQASFQLEHDDPMVRCVFQQLLERTDFPGVNWNTSSVQILKNSFVHDASLSQRLAFVENSLSTPAEFAALVQTQANGLRDYATRAVLAKLLALVPTPSTMTDSQKEEGFKNFLADPGVKMAFDMCFETSRSFCDYRTRNTAALTDVCSLAAAHMLVTTQRQTLEQYLPGITQQEMNSEAARAAHPELFQCSFKGKDSFLSTEFVNPRYILKMNTSDTEKLLKESRAQFLRDFVRTTSLPVEKTLQPRAEIEKHVVSFALFNRQTHRTGILTPYREISDKVKDEVAKRALSPDTLSPDTLQSIYSEVKRRKSGGVDILSDGMENSRLEFHDRGEVFSNAVERLAKGNTKQAAVALMCLTQNQDELRTHFEQFGGTFYDKGIFLEPDGNLRVVYASRREGPVHFLKSILVNPEGEAKIVPEEFLMSTHEEDHTGPLSVYQTFFEDARNERDARELLLESTERARGELMSASEMGERVCNSMLEAATL